MDFGAEVLQCLLEVSFPAVAPAIERASPDDDLIESGVMDSLTLIKLIGLIETRFAISVQDSEITRENFRSVNSIGEFLKNKLRN